jgi:hypothetical protein
MNPRVAGKAKHKKLSGNNFFSGYGSHHIRKRLAGALKASFVEVIKASDLKPLKAKDYPTKVTWEIHCPRGLANWDLDNLWFYKKFFIDACREAGILREDTIEFITGFGETLWYPVETDEDRKFVFTFTKDNRRCLNTSRR